VKTIGRGSTLEDIAVVDRFIALRPGLGRQLRDPGALVGLGTLALAASPFPGAMASGYDPNRGGAVLILGGLGSAIVVFAYVPVAMTLRNRVGALAQNLMPLPAEHDD
jgi:hypothetical protein